MTGLPYFDAHCDTITAALSRGQRLFRNGLQLDLERIGKYAPAAQVFAIFTRPHDAPPPAGLTPEQIYDLPDAPEETLTRLCDEALSGLLSELEANSGTAVLCRSAQDIKSANEQGKIAALISVEGAELLGCSTERLRTAYDRGVRLVNITWNFPNSLSGTAMSGNKSGLTEKGRRFVRFAQELGVGVDMSHISESAFWDCCEIAERPIIASHSNSKALCGHPRNLTDDQFRALVKLGGGAGLNLCTDFLGLGRDVEAVVEHAEHFLLLGGEKSTCLGGDLDGIDGLPHGMTGVQSWGAVYEAMLRRNWSEDLVRDVFYNNWLEIMEKMI